MPTIKTPEYKIDVDKDFSDFEKYLEKLNPSKVFIIVDENTKKHCLPILEPHLKRSYELLETISGETNKSLDSCVRLWSTLIDKKADRKSVVINLGGGVIGDLGGFAAATYMRGIPFIQTPTTLLSQVDASVGGKLGMDFKGYKNIIGAFKNPVHVWVHTPFLQSLPDRELLSGFAEVIKYGLIHSKPLWELIKQNGYDLSEEAWSKVITNSIKIKNKIVAEDPLDHGVRKILNFGHTVGHAIESFYLRTDTPLLHGEAIAKGMIAEGYLSYKLKRISIIEMEEINSLLESIYKLPDIDPKNIDQLIKLMAMDKKNEGGKKKFSLLKGIGTCEHNIEVSDEMIRESLLF